MTQQSVFTPIDVAGVVTAVQHARHHDLPVSVVAGGHGPWALAEQSGVRIELASLSGVSVNGTTVSIGGGATWGEVAARLAEDGLAISSGDTTTVGVGGLTLGGGIGWMTRCWGLAVDQLVGAQVVTAEGTVIETSPQAHPELFWALRGGGGNFGVVTRFDFAAHRLPTVVRAQYAGATDAGAVLRAARDAMIDAPHALTTTYLDVPPMDPSAPPGAALVAVWAGDDEAALREALAGVEAVDGITVEVATCAYRDVLDEPPGFADPEQAPPAFIGGNGLFASLDDDLIDELVALRATYPTSVVLMRSLGGAYGAVPQHSTPFPARDATWFIMAGGFDMPGVVDDAERTSLVADTARIQERRVAQYSNFTHEPSPEAVPEMFTPDAYARLHALKAQWDPRNMFRSNHNIVV